MKTLTILICISFLTGCQKDHTKDEIIASKCRLKLPINKAECESVGVYHTFGGRMQGLPVTNE